MCGFGPRFASSKPRCDASCTPTLLLCCSLTWISRPGILSAGSTDVVI